MKGPELFQYNAWSFPAKKWQRLKFLDESSSEMPGALWQITHHDEKLMTGPTSGLKVGACCLWSHKVGKCRPDLDDERGQ